eukprot:TRINITY_DN8426_c0_g1_i8.p2 TRINITY_DN8426_c0_g1~~TRINITY_DN8426_c0_g1_i8.p2  ORF type:complete len:104 (+),score=2.69 TRINITY_DN8426_c0_g1_i8:55-366(+)
MTEDNTLLAFAEFGMSNQDNVVRNLLQKLERVTQPSVQDYTNSIYLYYVLDWQFVQNRAKWEEGEIFVNCQCDIELYVFSIRKTIYSQLQSELIFYFAYLSRW